jgi:hypothetical protein
MHFSRTPRFARLLSVAAALACAATLAACGEGLEDEDGTDEAALDTAEEGLGIRNQPGDVLAPFPRLEISIPQEAPVCQDCETTGYIGHVVSGGVTSLTLRGVSAGTRLNTIFGGIFAPANDTLYVQQRQLINGVWMYVDVWSTPIAGFEPWAWSRSYNSKMRAYSTSNNVVLNATPISTLNAPETMRAALATVSNWRGATPNFRGVIYPTVTGGFGIPMPIPYVTP